MKSKISIKNKKNILTKKNNDWNKTLKMVKILELNNLFNMNNLNEIKENKDNKFVISKEIQFNNNINEQILEQNKKKSELLGNLNANINVSVEKIKEVNKNTDNIKKNNLISTNINSEFKNASYDPKGIINKNDADIVDIKKDGNCLYRCFSYFLLGNQNYYLEIKNLIIQWISNNYEKFTSFFGDDDKQNMTKEQLAQKEFEYTKEDNSWGGDLHINIFCILFNYDVAVFIESNGNFRRYFLFHIPEIIPEELVISYKLKQFIFIIKII